MQRAATNAATQTLTHARPRLAYSHAPLGRRYMSKNNPFSWMAAKVKQRFLEQRQRPQDAEKKMEEAKKAAAKRDEVSVFDAVAPVKVEAESTEVAAAAEGEDSGEAKPTRKAKVQKEIVKRDSHKYSTTTFKISHRKLNDLGRQIAGKPIDHAILQMQFSEKRASERIKHMLVTARDHAKRYKGMETGKLVVAESWVSKGKHNRKRIEPRGRGHTGIQTHPMARLSVVLKEGQTLEEQRAKERAKKLQKIVSASLARENRPIRNPGAMWAW